MKSNIFILLWIGTIMLVSNFIWYFAFKEIYINTLLFKENKTMGFIMWAWLLGIIFIGLKLIGV